MDRKTRLDRLCGCYVTVPTMFRDDDLELDLPAMERHIRFLIEGGLQTGNGVVLVGGAAGDFSTMTFDERVAAAETVVQAAEGRFPVIMGAQTTSTRELAALAKAAERVGAEYIQVSPPYYFASTEDDFFEYAVAAAEAADVGIVVYNTHWTSSEVSLDMVERLAELTNVVGLKWSVPGTAYMAFERAVVRFADRLSVIDNQLSYTTSHMMGARGIELHPTNYWPQWGVRTWELLESGEYVEAQKELVRVVMPFYVVWEKIARYTTGDGHLDKLCLELVGLGSSRSRPPTRDIRDRFREQVRQMMVEVGVPGVIPGPSS
jgi:dihydrodipicolinate synthase/N-acetylneuraminate lyase